MEVQKHNGRLRYLRNLMLPKIFHRLGYLRNYMLPKLLGWLRFLRNPMVVILSNSFSWLRYLRNLCFNGVSPVAERKVYLIDVLSKLVAPLPSV